MYTVFNREPFTPWKIAIVDRSIDKTMEEIEADDPNCSDYMEFYCTYRTTFRDGKECEQFSILLTEIDYVLLQLHIFKNGDIKYYSHMPASVDIIRKNNRIEILPLAYCKLNHDKSEIYYVEIEE